MRVELRALIKRIESWRLSIMARKHGWQMRLYRDGLCPDSIPGFGDFDLIAVINAWWGISPSGCRHSVRQDAVAKFVLATISILKVPRALNTNPTNSQT